MMVVNALGIHEWAPKKIEPGGWAHVAKISVIGHWLVGIVIVFELLYRPCCGTSSFTSYALMAAGWLAFNGYLHYRLVSKGTVTWPWLIALYALDLFLVSVCVAISDGFGDYFFHLFYYPALAAFAIVFTSFRLNLIVVTVAALTYVAISLTVGSGIDLEERDEKLLIVRIAVMYTVVATVNLASRFERIQGQSALERERALQRERVEFSRAIHDTAAQSAYMTGLGIDAARALAGDGNPELSATLESTSDLSRSTIWELRHPIHMGGIYDGGELTGALKSHATSFMNVTSVPTEMTQTGREPALSLEAKSLLFSIAHNALTNAHRHAAAKRVAVDLTFDEEHCRLSVSDDGIGLPDDYTKRGTGFTNMSAAAERLGGHLVVEQRGHLGGATVTCAIPSRWD